MFFAWLIQAACGNHQEEAAAGLLTDFLSCGSFNRPPRSLVSFFVEIATARHDSLASMLARDVFDPDGRIRFLASASNFAGDR